MCEEPRSVILSGVKSHLPTVSEITQGNDLLKTATLARMTSACSKSEEALAFTLKCVMFLVGAVFAKIYTFSDRSLLSSQIGDPSGVFLQMCNTLLIMILNDDDDDNEDNG